MITFSILVIVFLVFILPCLVAVVYMYHRKKIHEMILKDRPENYDHLIGKK